MEKPVFEKTPSAVRTAETAPRKEEEIIRTIDFILDHHESLREKWEELIEGLPLEGQLEKLETLAQKRREALAPKPYISEKLILLDELPAKAEALFSEAFHMLEERSQEIDRGFNGKIMEYVGSGPDEPNVVYKLLIRSPIGEQNDLLSEASYLADLAHLAEKYKDARIGAPQPFYCATITNARVIAMQKVPGLSIENILTRDISLPPDLDIDAIEHHLDLFIERINNEGFYHNDLRPGNIMIDLEREKPDAPLAYIVDTGNAKHFYGKGTHEREIDNTRDRVMLKVAVQKLRLKAQEQTG